MKQYIKYSYGDILYIRIAPYFLIFSLIMAYRSAETSPSDSQIFYVLLMFFSKMERCIFLLSPLATDTDVLAWASNFKRQCRVQVHNLHYSFVALLLYIVTATKRNLNLTAAFSFGFVYWNCRKWHFHDPTFKNFRGGGHAPTPPLIWSAFGARYGLS